jgi:hypothetical protein
MDNGCLFLCLIFETIHERQIKLRREEMGWSLYLSVDTGLYLYMASTVIN